MHFRLIASAGQARNPHSCLLWRRFVVQPVRSSSIASDRSTWPRAQCRGWSMNPALLLWSRARFTSWWKPKCFHRERSRS